ncbi:DUF4260 domain-containing protein [Halobacillus yeomjeoni]|uniref:DUF4260 domain-containing protein n=1 Tax=Halobacillus yeomjeoni TaxID=311194 RepID=A0A931HXW0_9BACI|nr:DUF4260 domain-containing protein [Halobacillus yeomjeoni]MBH0231430.1 DUF4260 domain-containing protein [Halobacillus yeomjeoni]
MPKLLLHIEGLIVFLTSVYFYAQTDVTWWLFFLCLLLPDLSMFGYVMNHSIGAAIYNVGHTYFIPLADIILSVILHQDLLLALSLIWTAHIGMDRAVGYGLKYPSNFKDTHLQKV